MQTCWRPQDLATKRNRIVVPFRFLPSVESDEEECNKAEYPKKGRKNKQKDIMQTCWLPQGLAVRMEKDWALFCKCPQLYR